MILKQGDLVEWISSDSSQIVWMICEDPSMGVVIHSPGLIKIGTITSNISDLPDLKRFKGTVNIHSN
jgi:hypothetical protein